MTNTTPIYTFLANRLQIEAIKHIISERSITCILDLGNIISEEMAATFKNNGIITMNFAFHFYTKHYDFRDKNYNIIFSKAIETQLVKEGLQRIVNGIEKGYIILIIEDEMILAKSVSYGIIGEYLKDKYTVIHYTDYNRYYKHQQIEEMLNNKKQESLLAHQHSLQLGNTGEELAALHLTQENYQILERNWNLHKGCEIDIIARKGNVLHFIEVKTRKSDNITTPEQAIDKKKIKNIMRAIKDYRYLRCLHRIEYQIDSIAIVYHSEDDYTLKHFENITQYEFY